MMSPNSGTARTENERTKSPGRRNRLGLSLNTRAEERRPVRLVRQASPSNLAALAGHDSVRLHPSLELQSPVILHISEGPNRSIRREPNPLISFSQNLILAVQAASSL